MSFSSVQFVLWSARVRGHVHRARYKRYKLGDTKDFDTLFFPEKDGLLNILHNFQNKTGVVCYPR